MTETKNLPPSTVEYLARLQAKAPKDVLKLELSMRINDQAKYVTVQVPKAKYPDGLEVIHITDVQYGHKHCNVKKFIEYRDWILSAPNRFVFFGGDMIDAATLISVGSAWENTEEPQGEIYRFVELAMPMRHRILGYVGGNHERRTIKTFGDAGQMIASLLRIPYSAGKQVIDIHYGKHTPHKNELFHGRGAAQTSGAKLMMIEKFAKAGSAQVFWVGHLHDTICKYYRRQVHAAGEIKLEKYCAVMSSSFLDFWGTYAEVAGMEPNGLDMWRLKLSPDGSWSMTIK